MITFLTLYLGLIVGSRHFELAVPEATARMEILLDGELRAELTQPPWAVDVDLGEDPLPRELVAVAYDAAGEPLGRAFQRLNVPHPPVEVAIALDSEGGRVRAARLVWEAAADEALTGVRMRLDGRKIPVEDPTHIPGRGGDEDDLHLALRARWLASGSASRRPRSRAGLPGLPETSLEPRKLPQPPDAATVRVIRSKVLASAYNLLTARDDSPDEPA